MLEGLLIVWLIVGYRLRRRFARRGVGYLGFRRRVNQSDFRRLGKRRLSPGRPGDS